MSHFSSSKPTLPVISEDVALILEPDQLRPTRDGKRDISTSSYCSDLDVSTSSSDNSITSPASTVTSASSYSMITIPSDIYSPETYEFLGFEREVAEELWERFLEGRRDYGAMATLIDFAKGQVKSARENALVETDDWDGVMTRMGISLELRLAILSPHYKDIRLTESVIFWLVDTFKSRLAFLYGLNEKVEKTQQAASESRSNTPDMAPMLAIRPPKMARQKEANPQVGTSYAEIKKLENHLILYKGGLEERLKSVFATDGSIRLNELYSAPPTDFHPTNSIMLYFSKHRYVAQQYMGYAQIRSPTVCGAILAVAVPQSLLENPLYLWKWENDIWGRVVCASRKNENEVARGQLPDSLRWVDGFSLVIGNICAQPTDVVKRLQPAELKPLKLGKLGEVSQHCFRSDAKLDQFKKECRGKLVLEIFPPRSEAGG